MIDETKLRELVATWRRMAQEAKDHPEKFPRSREYRIAGELFADGLESVLDALLPETPE